MKLGKKVIRIIAGVVALGLVAGVVYFGFFDKHLKRVSADFAAAVGIYRGTDVRMLGVKVGTVQSVTPKGSYVHITMEYDGQYKLPQDAIAVQITSSLVEDRYIQLAPTYTGGPVLGDGANIPQTRTAVPAEIDQIYDALNRLNVALGPQGANKNGALNDLLQVSAQNLGGNGAALGQSLHNLSEATQTLANSRDDLFGTVKNLQAFTDALAQSDDQVRHLNDQLANVAGQLADERQELGAALHNLAQALDSVNGFVKNNAAALHTDIVGLEQVTNLLVKDKAALEESLAVAPVALANLSHTYNPSSGTLDTRSSLSSLGQAQDVCGVLGELGKLPAGSTVLDVCNKVAASLGTTLQGLINQVSGGAPTGLPTLPGVSQ